MLLKTSEQNLWMERRQRRSVDGFGEAQGHAVVQESSRPITAPICATSLTGAKRSRRAIRLSCKVAGMASGGNGPVNSSKWALLASLLERLEGRPECKDRTEVIEARRLYEAGEIDAGFNLLRPILFGT